ncbi:MAG: hypothetical protein PWP10_3299 [Clostridiales bacterium]|jgi:hypothetical protein|nr:hypothetical protein [Clostridiales bacterium]
MNKHQQNIIIMFLLPIFILAVFKIIWPDREVSEQENRRLQTRPVFSWSGFFDGSFSTDVEKWFADQFPFRQVLIDVNTNVRSLMSFSFADDHVTLIQGPANDLGNGQILTDFNSSEQTNNSEQIITETSSEQTTTTTENETEETEPVSDIETDETETPTITESEPAISETQPQPTPEQKPLPGVDGPVDNYSAVIIVNNVAMELYGFNQAKADHYADLINRLAERTPDSQVYNLLAPTAIEFYSPEKYHTLSSSQSSAINHVYSKLSPTVRTVDAYSKLAANWQDYLYFRSDHHWTALGAYQGYAAFAEAAGVEAVSIEAMTHGAIEGGFLGSLYRYTQNNDLKNNPDTVYYYEPSVNVAGLAYTDSEMSGGREIELINKNPGNKNQYLAFIEGDHPLAHFQTSVKNGRSVIVIKESYGNAFVPYLSSHYENIYVADPRNITMDLPDFVSRHQIQDIIVINYSFAVSNQKWVDGFSRMIG